jgi:hypothetical protein
MRIHVNRNTRSQSSGGVFRKTHNDNDHQLARFATRSEAAKCCKFVNDKNPATVTECMSLITAFRKLCND